MPLISSWEALAGLQVILASDWLTQTILISDWSPGQIVCDAVIAPRDTRVTLARALQISMFHHVPLRDERGSERNVVRM